MKLKQFFLLILIITQGITAQIQYLSPQAELSVLTVDPGTSLNDAFGHSGFRVKDTTGLDVVFDYGRYPFNDPNFYLNFARGKLTYSMGGTQFEYFYQFYSEENRGIQEQVLNLTQKEKQALYNFLLNNYLPENRDYQYDFFYDNCATRIKDVLLMSVSQPIAFHLPKDYQEASFRTLIQQNLDWNSWGSLGIDIALGAVIDKTATPEEQMFLPKNIARFFEVATLGNKRALIKSSQMLFEKDQTIKDTTSIWSPLLILSLLALVILFITYKDHKNNQRSRWLDGILFTITGLIGLFLVLLWFATNHTATAFNYNLLWAFPLNLVVFFPLLRKVVRPWVKKYLKLLLILLCLLVFHWITGVQVFAFALIPLLIALSIRYIYVIQVLEIKKEES